MNIHMVRLYATLTAVDSSILLCFAPLCFVYLLTCRLCCLWFICSLCFQTIIGSNSIESKNKKMIPFFCICQSSMEYVIRIHGKKIILHCFENEYWRYSGIFKTYIFLPLLLFGFQFWSCATEIHFFKNGFEFRINSWFVGIRFGYLFCNGKHKSNEKRLICFNMNCELFVQSMGLCLDWDFVFWDLNV